MTLTVNRDLDGRTMWGMRTLKHLLAVVLVVVALALAPVTTSPPAGADPADVFLPKNTMSPKYGLGACRYKVMWGNFITSPYAKVHLYNPATCGTTVVLVELVHNGVPGSASSSTIVGTGSDACGPYSIIQADASAGNATRALVWMSAGLRWYDTDGTAGQTAYAC